MRQGIIEEACPCYFVVIVLLVEAKFVNFFGRPVRYFKKIGPLENNFDCIMAISGQHWLLCLPPN